MDIRIDNYRLSSDPHNIILSEVKTLGKDSQTPGEEYDSNYGYYANIEQALIGLLKRIVRKSDATTLSQLLHELQDAKKMLHDLLDEDLNPGSVSITI